MSRTVGIIRVVTTDDREFLEKHGRILETELGVRTVTEAIPDQPRGVFDDETFAAASAKVPVLAEKLASQVDAILISCAADPGLAGARERVSVPVIGAGSAAAAVAVALGNRIGVLDLTPDTPETVTSVLGDRLVRSLQPEGVRETRDLLTPEGFQACLRGGDDLVAAGAEVVMLACTGMTTIGLAEPLRARLGIPVVDAVRTGGLLASRY
ncbi:aspartate/glutamate racemase family protein [Kineosporia babensis]|uniref:Aspartate/glutamate racemase family protein n=1 Tax=Kineosporia babensis TaxID=499548 RepID=A0A9X1SXA8_9ACTN|nr:aspartate/glutamate racemase family protein [Kineosporia babensis]MCD5316017.1 aspartate/glutamate racemase family protein [Kineosporia babensis]